MSVPFRISFSIVLAGVALVLSGCNVLRPTQIVSRTPLADTHWTLTAIRGKSTKGPKNASEVDIKFNSVSDVTGFTGCDRYSGKGNVSNNQLTIIVKTTGSDCGKNQKFEASYLDALSTARFYRIAGNTLYLLDANNNELAQFNRR